MEDRIEHELARIEREHDVRVLYACESGSRAWGFPSVDSDWDVRFIYVRPVAAYLKLAPPRDVIELPIDDDLDISGWDLYKTCHLLRKMNPALLEWLGSPIIYREVGPVASTMRKQVAAHFNRRACCEHYLSMARGNYDSSIVGRERVRTKKYLYALRPVFCLHWLLENESFPPTKFPEVIEGVGVPPAVRQAIDGLIESKLDAREVDDVPPIEVFDDYLATQFEQLPDRLKGIPGAPFPVAGLDTMIHDAITGAV